MRDYTPCCEEFAYQSGEIEDAYELFEQWHDGTWRIFDKEFVNDTVIEGVRFCPYCGARIDTPGIGLAIIGGSSVVHPDGRPVRLSEIDMRGVYEIDGKVMTRVEGRVASNPWPEFRRAQRPRTRAKFSP